MFTEKIIYKKSGMSLQEPLNPLFLLPAKGGLAQLARAFAWHAKGHRFDSGNLHKKGSLTLSNVDLTGFFLSGMKRRGFRKGHGSFLGPLFPPEPMCCDWL